MQVVVGQIPAVGDIVSLTKKIKIDLGGLSMQKKICRYCIKKNRKMEERQIKRDRKGYMKTTRETIKKYLKVNELKDLCIVVLS